MKALAEIKTRIHGAHQNNWLAEKPLKDLVAWTEGEKAGRK